MPIIAYYFSSPKCVPCKYMNLPIADMKEEFNSIAWVHVNIDNDPDNLAETYGVTSVPTLIVDTTCGYVGRHTGTNISGYYSIIRTAIQRSKL